MYLLGYSLNNLTLMALTISTGFVVDDAIVMIENIDRYLEAGEPPLRAALKGSEQIGFTIVSLTVSLIAVLIPLLFMGDIVGRLFREFAVTLAVTILVSAGVSLSLTPMMCAKLLKHRKEGEKGRFYEVTEDFYNRVIASYGRTVKWVLKHQTATLLVTVGTLVLTLFLYVIVPKGFFPVQDTGVILGISEAPDNISFDAMSLRQQELAKVILKDKDVESLSSFIGVDGTNTTPNSGRIQINLKPRDERDADASAIIRRLQPALAHVDGITLYMQPVQDLTVEDRVSRTQFQYSIEDADAQELAQWTPKLVEKLRASPVLRDVATDQLNGGLRTTLTIDRDTASRLGILPQAIDNTLYDAFGQRQVSIIFTQLNQYHVVLEVLPSFAMTPEAMNDMYVRPASVLPNSGAPTGNAATATTSGTPVPLSTFVRMQSGSASLAVNHQGQFPVVTLSFNLAPGASLGDATRAIQEVEKEIQMPASIHASFQGTAAAFQNSLSSEPFLILAAIITVYIVLGSSCMRATFTPSRFFPRCPQPEWARSAGSYDLPGIDLTRSVALIGIILLIGIVKKNAIMMIDFALEAERQHGTQSLQKKRFFEACLLRFRPIMMTTMPRRCSAASAASAGIGNGRGVAATFGDHDCGRTVAEPIAHALYHARGLSVV
jgi:multidrug efflux pump